MKVKSSYGLITRLQALRDLLQQGEYTKAEIFRRLPRYYPSGTAGSRRLGRDISALRQLGYTLRVDRTSQTYTLQTPATLNLSSREIQTLALIRESFETLTPKSKEVLDALNHIVAALPKHQRAAYNQPAPTAIRLQPAVDYRPHANTLRLLEQAVVQGNKVRLVYPSLEDGSPMTHVGVEPYEIQFFDRHFYLIGLSPLTSQMMEFRLDRLRQVEVMPGQALRRRKRQTLGFSYRLSAHIARQGISERFLHPQLEPQPDGSVIIQAEGYSEFRILQDLLRYGEQAELLTPPKLRAQMAQVIRAMAALYPESSDK